LTLSNIDIRQAIKQGYIVFDGDIDEAVQPASIDLRLGGEIIRRRRGPLNKIAPRLFPLPPIEIIVGEDGKWNRLPRPEHYESFFIPSFEEHQFNLELHAGLPFPIFGKPKPFILYPGDFCLGVLKDTVGPNCYHLAAKFQNKSSIARLGGDGYGGSGWVDPTNVGKWTLELHNKGHEPFQIFKNMNIIQLCFEQLQSPATIRYEGKYKNPKRPEGAK
jgi:deoxycytidine triphosphate deaminase